MGQYPTPLQRDSAIRRLTHLARFLDNAFVVPGIRYRVGYDAIIGLVPGVGDVVTAAMSLYVVYEAHRLGVRKRIIALMLWNILLDFLISEIPGVGDIVDFFFKSNTRNIALLGRELNIPELANAGTGRLNQQNVQPPPPQQAAEWSEPQPARKHVDNAATC